MLNDSLYVCTVHLCNIYDEGFISHSIHAEFVEYEFEGILAC